VIVISLIYSVSW